MKVAIVGGGIVGATCSYYLSKESNVELTLFDYGVGQATRASAGIISPWFSKRRNKPWYKMARLGADFYLKLVQDLKKDGFETNFYSQTGVYLLKKDVTKLVELKELAEKRRELSPMIGDLKILSLDEAKGNVQSFDNNGEVLFASGGGRVEGARFVKTLLKASNAEVVNKKVSLEIRGNQYYIEGKQFDKVVLATGAWLKEILSPLGFVVDVRPQKGQLRDYKIKNERTGDFPVIMPEGELDIIPFEQGIVSVGATHENEMDFDLTVDKDLLDKFESEALQFFGDLKDADVICERVGTRAYTSDYSPFFGKLEELPDIYVASGLGSSGLTTGPIIGYSIARLIANKDIELNVEDYSPKKYIKK